MKDKFKMLFIVWGAMTLFFACQKEDSFQEPLEEAIFKNDIQVKKVTFEEVKHNSLLKKSLDKIEGKFDFNKRKESQSILKRKNHTFGSTSSSKQGKHTIPLLSLYAMNA
ncbi:MAG: hypothetical protein R2783_06305 [Gelidibacter sp.]